MANLLCLASACQYPCLCPSSYLQRYQKTSAVAPFSYREPAHPAASPVACPAFRLRQSERWRRGQADRKSTRLNSSHGYISYAVFCLKKKKTCGTATPATISRSKKLLEKDKQDRPDVAAGRQQLHTPQTLRRSAHHVFRHEADLMNNI